MLILLNFLNASGQTEFLVKVDPNNGTFANIDSISGVKLVLVAPNLLTYDKNNHRYIFVGDNNGNYNLYSVDANTGNIISNPSIVLPSDPSEYVFELKYDNSSNTLYGLHKNNSENRIYFVSVNSTNGVYTIIDSLPGVKTVVTEPHYTIFDETHHRYIFTGGDNSGNTHLYSVDANTGNIITNPSFPVLSNPSDALLGLQYDNTSNIIYAMHWINSESREYLISVNPATGTFATIDSIPGVKSIITIPHYFTYDEIHHHYFFRGGDNSGNYHLYSVDANTGNIISSPLFPVLTDSSDNLIELQFDNSSGILYALHWEAHTFTGIFSNEINNSFNVYPNPVQQSFTIELPQQQNFNLFVYDVTGRKIYKRTNATGNVSIDCSSFNAGIYFVQAVNEKNSLSFKLIKQ